MPTMKLARETVGVETLLEGKPDPLQAAIWHWAVTATQRRIEAVTPPKTMRERKIQLRLEHEITIYQRNYERNSES